MINWIVGNCLFFVLAKEVHGTKLDMKQTCKAVWFALFNLNITLDHSITLLQTPPQSIKHIQGFITHTFDVKYVQNAQCQNNEDDEDDIIRSSELSNTYQKFQGATEMKLFTVKARGHWKSGLTMKVHHV